ncbi:MAG: hypothetical protein GY855_06385, partial [candidate division Zixibacteria bacterium]|nr:hypothetical protein [candidate division Zixibacteria bacterium]
GSPAGVTFTDNGNGTASFDWTPTYLESGSYPVTFTATDDSGAVDTEIVTITVDEAGNQAPVVIDIPDQTIAEGATFATINLDDYVSDVDNVDADMTWDYSGQTDLIIDITARVATITTLDLDWNGAETITFTASDPGLLSDSDPVLFTVTAVNDAPIVSNIPDQTIAEGSIFTSINLDDYVSDVDNLDTEITWAYSGQTDLIIDITARVATITIPGTDWNGAETITFTASDPGVLSDNDAVLFTVTAVNDDPVVTDIPDQTVAEGATFATINLDDYVSDVDDLDTDMTWGYSGQTDLIIDITARVATITIPNLDWNGAETITFTASDPGALSDSDPVLFTVDPVNDDPIVTDIPDQTIAEGATFATINLDNYVSDVDDLDTDISWAFSGQTDLIIDITARVATITIPNLDWNGAETITFTASDPGLLSDNDPVLFTVDPVNDDPIVTDIPDQTIAEGATFTTINLDDYVSDVDNFDSEIGWGVTGYTDLVVDIVAGIATISMPGIDWNGDETITFTATDPGALFDTDAATFTVTAVNDAPVASDIPDQTIDEGATFATITLDDYVTDVDNLDTELTWSKTGNSQLLIDITDRVATIIIPNSEWSGSEVVTFKVSDPSTLFDENIATFTVSAVNDAPVVTDIPGQTIVEGSTFTTLNLDDYVSDIDNTDAEMNWSYSGNTELSIDITARVATITMPDTDWNDSEIITFTATDPGSLSDSDPATFVVTSVNDAPVVTDIPNQTVAEGSTFTTINLDDYVSDVDNLDSEISWTYSGQTDLIIDITARVATITIPNIDWNGAEVITFTATDIGLLTDNDAATFTVSAGNDAPVVSNIPDQTIDEGAIFTTINLDDYVSDVDNLDSEISWSYSGNTELTVDITARVATITIPDVEWNGLELITFTATDPSLLSNSDLATFTVNAVNDAPIVSGIPDQTIAEGATFTAINLDDYVTDIDNLVSEMSWSYSGETDLIIDITSRVATISMPSVDWDSFETITFTATDPGTLSDGDDVTFTVTGINDAPVVIDIPDQTIAEGSAFATINLDDYVSDVDNLDSEISWDYSGQTDLIIDITARVATITIPDLDWNGAESIIFTASDPGVLSDSDPVLFTVNAVNDAPIVSNISDQTVAEGGTFTTINLDSFVSDVDNSDTEMSWDFSGNTELSISIINRVAIIGIPSSDWNGFETVTFTASDPSLLSSSDAVLFTVTAVNNAPVVSDIPDQIITEGATFATINLDNYVTDIDDLDSDISWSFVGNSELTVSIDVNRVATIGIPDADWNGTETITFTATDIGLLSDDDLATFEVTAVNDAPVVADIPDQTIDEGLTFATINLDDYVSDVDNLDSEISWIYGGNIELTVSIDINRIATITIPNINWSGSEIITFTASDPGLLSDNDPSSFIVTAINDAPVVTDIPNQTIAEGSSFTTISLDDYVSDVEDIDTDLDWTYSGNAELTVSIDVDRIATISIPDADWNGDETITFTATDLGLLTGSDPVTFTVNALNDAPIVSDIPDQTLAEGATFATISLDDFVSDVDNLDSEISWSYGGNSELTVSIDIDRIVTITTPDIDWNGSESISFTATDPGLLNSSDLATFTITAGNDAPVVSDIPDQTFSEGSTFTAINLDDYVTDVDNLDTEISWSFSGATDLSISINVDRVATITAPDADWFGSEMITFTATDPSLLSNSNPATFTLTAINDAPVVADIPAQTVAEGATFTTINLDDYITDVDNLASEMTWGYSGNIELSVSIVNRVAIVGIPDAEWSGAEVIIFVATDPGSLSNFDAAMFTVTAVNDAPVVTDIGNQAIAEGATFTTISLDDFVSDTDNLDSEMSWSFVGNSQLTISLDANRIATISIPNTDWNGSETITFTATDPGALSDADPATFEVTAVNDAPVVANIPDQVIAEGATFTTISLDNYVTDIDNNDTEISWTFLGNTDLTVDITARVATITIPDVNWNGAEIITFTATDPGTLSDSDPATFTVTAGNDAPVVTDIPNQTLSEGSTFATINLDDYVSDIDNTDAEMIWTYTGNTELSIDITARIATITVPDLDWNGDETITFRSSDPGGLFDEDIATFTISGINDAPVISDIPNQTIAEGASFATINLDDYVSDIDNLDSEISWTYGGNTELLVTINVDRVATVTTPDIDWNGDESITFTATDPGLLNVFDAATFTVTAGNDAPVVADIPNQTVAEGATFTTINLDDYVDDVDNLDTEIDWTFSGNTELTVSIDINRIATIGIPDTDWNGSELITFTATDPTLLSNSNPATFTVTGINDAPVASDIPNQVVAEGASFATINLDDYVTDIDNLASEMTWTFSGNINLSVSIVNRVAIISAPDADWTGAEVITFVVTDPGSLNDLDAAQFTVTAVNDAPILADIPDQTIDEGATFVTISLDDFVSDVDNLDSEMSWGFIGQNELTVSIDVNRIVTITIPDINWNGNETITFTATDPGTLADSDAATFIVNAVNDAPVVLDIPDQTIDEGSTFITINLDSYVTDLDNLASDMTWSYANNTDLIISIDVNRVATISIPGIDWNGFEAITFRATDPGTLFDEDIATFTVNAINDAPVVIDIPDQTVDEGATFTTINLDDYVSDVDNLDAELTWGFSGQIDLIIDITAHIATITIPDINWNGDETITFTASDPGALSDNNPVLFTVTAINDAPVVADIPDQVLAEGATFATVNLDDYVDDLDNLDSEISWTAVGNVDLTVNIVGRVATITAPDIDWNGSEVITFTAADPGLLSDFDDATFALTAGNDTPVVIDIPDQTIAEGAIFTTINLDDFVSDVDNLDSEMSWGFSGQTDLIIDITARVATITIPDVDWNGSEIITFTATDPGLLSDSDPATFTITGINDDPVLAIIGPQSTTENVNLNFVISATDVESTPAFTTSVLPTGATFVDNGDGTGTFDWTPTFLQSGSYPVTFTATDDSTATDFEAVTITVIEGGNQLPILAIIGAQSTTENVNLNFII